MRRVLGGNHNKPKPEAAEAVPGVSEARDAASAAADADEVAVEANAYPAEPNAAEASAASSGVGEDEFVGEAVCAECESGGLLDCCDGCARSWHVECLSLVR